jgi:hypothetical protein
MRKDIAEWVTVKTIVMVMENVENKGTIAAATKTLTVKKCGMEWTVQ